MALAERAAKPSASLVHAFLHHARPFLEGVLSTDQLAACTAPTTVDALLATSLVVVDNLQFLGSKLLKASASSFAYTSFPSADTEKLTAVVANLVSGESLGPLMASCCVQRESELHVLLGYCCRVLGPEVSASAVLAAHFAAVLEVTKNALDIPQIVCALRPGTNLQGLTRDQRIDLVRDELRSRFVLVSVPQPFQDSDEDEDEECSFRSASEGDCKPSTTRQRRAQRTFRVDVSKGSLERHTVYFYSELEAREHVLVVARQWIKESKAERRMQMGRSNDADESEDGEEKGARAARAHLSLNDIDPAQAASFGLFLMHTCKRILRFESPFDTKLEQLGRLVHCIESGGWIPIMDIQTLLLECVAATCTMIELPSLDFICRMLEEHDGLQRFEIGHCTLASSPFFGVRCARALYAHHGAVACATVPLYRSILDSFDRPKSCPPMGWLMFDSKQIKSFKSRGFRLFDNNLLLTVVTQESIVSTFIPYLDRGGMDASVPFLQRCMLDEKVKSPMFFLEVYLGAAFHDSQMTVKQHPHRGDVPGHYILMPSGHRYRKKHKGTEMKYFPLRFLSGRTLELKSSAAAGDGGGGMRSETGEQRNVRVLTSTVALPPDPMVLFDEQELEELLRLGGGTSAEPISLDASPERQEPAPEEIVRLDDGPLRSKITSFHGDANVVMMELEVPRCSRTGGTLFERSKSLGDLKTWITTLGLEYRELPRRGQFDVYLLRKHQAFPEYVLDEIMAELSLEGLLERRDLLRNAITRECIHSTENYERLEFIGDAVLDLIVALDAALIFGGCLTNEDRTKVEQLQTMHSDAASIVGPPRSIVQVAVDLCRNEVLCELLPSVLRNHMGKLYGEDIPLKVKADMFEAIVGAVYDSALGMDLVRRVVADLYRQNLSDVIQRKANSPDALWKFRLAMQICPYLSKNALHIIDSIQRLNCTFILVGKCESELAEDGGGGDHPHGSGKKKHSTAGTPTRRYATVNSHLASTGFPRIQDKEYATHFTTGYVYSYRRLSEYDVPIMNNKILQLFSEGNVAFVNETLGNVTRLTFDIDGVDMHSFGLIRILRSWIRATWGRRCPCALVLNCSGRSVVSKKQKFSYHVHIPDQLVSLSELTQYTSMFRAFIVSYLAQHAREHCVGTGSIWVGKMSSTSGKRTSVIGRVVLDTRLMRRRLSSALEHEEMLSVPYAVEDCHGTRSLPSWWVSPGFQAALFLSFLGLKDLLHAMAVSKTFYRGGVFLLTLFADDEAPRWMHPTVDSWIRQYIASLQRVTKPDGAAASLPPVVDAPRGVDLNDAHVLQLLNPDLSWSGRFVLCSVHQLQLVKVTSFQDVEGFVEEHHCGKAKRFFEGLLPLLEKSVFDRPFWEKTVDHGLVASKKLRMYLNDKFDTVYGQEYRPLLFDRFVDPSERRDDEDQPDTISSTLLLLPSAAPGECGERTGTDDVGISHRAILEETSLSEQYYWDADGNPVSLWDTCKLYANCSCDPEEDSAPSVAVDLLPHAPAKTSVSILPTFDDIRRSQSGFVTCNDWQLWCSGVFSLTEMREDTWSSYNTGGSAKLQRHGGAMPVALEYREDLGHATFVCLGGSLLNCLPSADLTAALADGGGKGMILLSRLLTPHVHVDACWRTPMNQFRSSLALWEEPRGGGVVNNSHVAPSRAAVRANEALPVINGVSLTAVSAPKQQPMVPPSAVAAVTPLPIKPPPHQSIMTRLNTTTPAATSHQAAAFNETASYFRMKFDHLPLHVMGTFPSCQGGRLEEGDPMLSDVRVAKAIRQWVFYACEGFSKASGSLVATRRRDLHRIFNDFSGGAFAPSLTVVLLDSIKPSKRATAALRAALVSQPSPFHTLIYAEPTLDVPAFYWLLERLQPGATCWFMFQRAFEDAQKLRGASCFCGPP